MNSGSVEDDLSAVLCESGGSLCGYLLPVMGDGGWTWGSCGGSVCGCLCVDGPDRCVEAVAPAGELWVAWGGESDGVVVYVVVVGGVF